MWTAVHLACADMLSQLISVFSKQRMVDAILILSSGRSGSTLLNLLLGSHPRVAAVGELTHLPKSYELDAPCSCGMPIRSCPLWSAVLASVRTDTADRANEGSASLDLGFIGSTRSTNARRLKPWYRVLWRLRNAAVYADLCYRLHLPGFMRRQFDKTIANTFAVYQAVRAHSGADVVVDSSKSYLKGIALHLAAPDRVRLIMLTRDGRANLHSRLKAGVPRRQAIRNWLNFYRHALPLIEKNVSADNFLVVRYEELADCPERELRRICDFCNLDYEPTMINFAGKVHHLPNGNDMRFRRDITIRVDSEWVQALAPADRVFFETMAGKVNRRLGYCPEPR
jgi:hypothetical protein